MGMIFGRSWLTCFLTLGWMTVAGASIGQTTLSIKGLFPAANARNICPDTPLHITFSTPPTLGTSGRIQVFDAADHKLIESIDVSARTATKTIGGLGNFNYYPVTLSGNEVSIYLKNGALAYDKTYYVTIDAGVFKSGEADYAGITRPAAWRFRTRSAAPRAGATRITVAADGSGNFCTVQGALDHIPAGNTAPITIYLKKGKYSEIVFFIDKHAITLLGEDRRQSILTYANDENLNNGGGNSYAGSTPNPGGEALVGGNIYRRGVFLAHRVNDLVIANLTVRNTTPQGGSQAEAIILNGTPAARAILKDVDLYSRQDTLQINGQAYISNCYIEGDVDFMWGTGPCFFENCLCRSLRSGTYYTQIRNPAGNHGYVFLRCLFDGIQGVTGNYLSRVQPARFPHSEIVLLDCTLGDAVGSVAWQFQDAPGVVPVSPPDVHYWEFNSHSGGGKPVDVSRRLVGSRQLKQPEDSGIISNYGDPVFVLGNGWNPKLAPIFVVAPEKTAVTAVNQPPAQPARKQPMDSKLKNAALLRGGKPLIVLVGDSTVAEVNGWGPGFKERLTGDIECVNRALNGRSSMSFINEGHWKESLDLKRDYVLIQWGHNDQKTNDPTRGTDPETAYRQYLRHYIEQARAIGAKPVLIASVSRRRWGDDGKTHSDLFPYVDAMKAIAKMLRVPLIDLHALSIELYDRLGKAEVDRFSLTYVDPATNPSTPAVPIDNTHFNHKGSQVIGQIVAEQLAKVVPELARYIK